MVPCTSLIKSSLPKNTWKKSVSAGVISILVYNLGAGDSTSTSVYSKSSTFLSFFSFFFCKGRSPHLSLWWWLVLFAAQVEIDWSLKPLEFHVSPTPWRMCASWRRRWKSMPRQQAYTLQPATIYPTNNIQFAHMPGKQIVCVWTKWLKLHCWLPQTPATFPAK